MSDIVYMLAEHYPGWLLWLLMCLCAGAGLFVAWTIGSVRWWYIKKTRLPQLWKQERAQYLAKINRLEREGALKDEEISRLKTAAFGTVVMEFRSAIERAREA